MTNDDKDLKPAINTDQTIYRQPTTDYGTEDGNDKGMEPSVFVTKEGAVGFNHYGKCVVKPIKEWVEMAWNTPQQPSEKKALSVEDIKSIAIKATRKIKYPDGKTEYSLWLSNDEWTTIAQAIHSALPAQREVRYPEKLDCKCKIICLCGNWHQLPKGEVWNSCIDEFKKLNS